MQRKVQFEQGAHYHIYNRGCNRGDIFLSDENYRFVLKNMKKRISNFHVTVLAYCLMPNHYHFLVRQDGEQSAGKFIQLLFNQYTKAFNAMYNRTGTLFEGPFKAIYIDKQEYLIHLCRYIHRNPVEAGLVEKSEDWQYSNYCDWIGIRKGTMWEKDFLKDNFHNAEKYREFVMAYVSPKKENLEWQKYLHD